MMTTRTHGDPTSIMGVLNVTPDSFFDGGRFVDVDAALLHAKQMVRDGAHIIDIGGESSRPGSTPVPPEEEQSRVLPIIEPIAASGTFVSIDTYHADTAKKAIVAGARMVNDITALRGDDAMAEVIAEAGCEVVLMHMQGTPSDMQRAPEYTNVIEDIIQFFEERIAYAESAGIARDRIWLDPGFGFGKTVPHNLEILKRLDAFTVFDLPILMGTSNKSTIGAVLDSEADDRTEGTAATVAVSIMNGASAVRVHDVAAMAKVAKMTDAIRLRERY